jgi:hypothetical protein
MDEQWGLEMEKTMERAMNEQIDNAMYEEREKEMELERENYLEQDLELNRALIQKLRTQLARKHGL